MDSSYNILKMALNTSIFTEGEFTTQKYMYNKMNFLLLRTLQLGKLLCKKYYSWF